jgi:nicotinate-nucleotide adenylyltransferase
MWFAGPLRRIPESGRPQALKVGFTLTPGMRVGLYGGSFNPVHDGHVQVAQTALVRLRLDRVLWLVTPGNPLKARQSAADLEERMAGVRKAANGPSMIVSSLEASTGSAFSVDTIRILQARFPGVHFVWVMGADNLAGFHRWRGWPDIIRRIPIAIVARPGSILTGLSSPAARRFARSRLPVSQAGLLALKPPPAWIYLPMPLNPLSSTAIRAGRSRGRVGG